MPGLSPKLPLRRDYEDGFGLTKSFTELASQNLKNIVLTSPGERVMDPEFGVGIRRYLFRNDVSSIKGEIKGRVKSQVRKYLPYLDVISVDISSLDDHNTMHVRISYKITPLSMGDTLVINVS
tara:strand:+ start:1018 stop:1386 length:369 start_codon:yes stop_codon:yes gene_type:complete